MPDDSPIISKVNGTIYYRASGLGSCIRALWAARSGYDAMSPPLKLQLAFDEGHAAEQGILDRLVADEGWTVHSPQEELTIDLGRNEHGERLVVRGHADAIGRPPWFTNTDIDIPIDAKAFSQSTLDDFLSNGIQSFPHYSWQQSVYAIAYSPHHSGGFCLPLLNKDINELTVRVYSEPIHSLAAIAERVAYIEALFDGGGMPTDFACDARWGCPYRYLHDEKETAELTPEQLSTARAFLKLKGQIDTLSTIASRLKGQLTESLDYTDDRRTFRGDGVQILIQNNPKRMDTRKVKQLLTEAELDVDDYYIPGEGVRATVSEPEREDRKER